MFRVVKWVFRTILVMLFLLSITLNVASFVGGALWMVASAAWEGATGITSFASAQVQKVTSANARTTAATKRFNDAVSEQRRLQRRVNALEGNLVSERRISQKASRELAQAQGDLLTSRRAVQRLERELADPALRTVTYRGQKMAMRTAVSETADGISSRAAKTASRELASMPGESIPFWGTAVVVGVTALELRDLCNTIKDMNELKLLFNPELAPDPNEATVCSMRVPSREELWEMTKSAPGEAWETAREATPTLEEIKQWEMPDVDAHALWASTKDGTASTAGWLKDTTISIGSDAWTGTKNLGGEALDATSSGLSAIGSTVTGLFGEEEKEE